MVQMAHHTGHLISPAIGGGLAQVRSYKYVFLTLIVQCRTLYMLHNMYSKCVSTNDRKTHITALPLIFQ